MLTCGVAGAGAAAVGAAMLTGGLVSAGINVVDQVKLSHVESNISARYKLKNIIGEDEDSDTVVVKDDQMLYMKNKKTGKGVLVHFD